MTSIFCMINSFQQSGKLRQNYSQLRIRQIPFTYTEANRLAWNEAMPRHQVVRKEHWDQKDPNYPN
jgi:hypothetical protein